MKIGIGVFDRITQGKDGRHGMVVETHAGGWVTVVWDDGYRGLAHVSTLWYE